MKDDSTISLLNEISELVYIADINTYELLFINQAGIDKLHLGDYHGKKCYELLQNQDAPCTFCTNAKLSAHKFYNWEITNPVFNRHYLLKDKLINWFGKPARLEIAFDVTEQVLQKNKLQAALDVQKLISHCVKKLYTMTDLDKAINEVLQSIGEFLDSKRVYIFKIYDSLMDNTYEWCADGVSPQINNLKRLNIELIRDWQPYFEKLQCVDIQDIQTIKDKNPDTYATLAAQDIVSLLVAPIFMDNKLYGYLGIDNYDTAKVKASSDLLLSISIFIAYAIRHKQHLEMLYQLSHHDLLTGALNRNAFMRATAAREAPDCSSLGIVYADINGMKDINDKHGHLKGDSVLIATAQILTSIFGNDSLFRIGGDEFVVMDFNHSESDFIDRVNHLKTFYLNKNNPAHNIAIGSSWSAAPADINLLLLNADNHMYQDKKKYYYAHKKAARYRHSMDDVLCLSDIKTLTEALLKKRFQLYFQPKISLQTEQAIGCEVLIRYCTENGKMIMPDKFIPLLEETELIKQLDLYVFEETCRQILSWQQQGLTVKPLSVNLSRSTLSSPALAETLLAIVQKYTVDISLLELEVTETVEATNNKHFILALTQLKAKGFSISIDDFGVKQANLSLFTTIDFDILKLDRSLIQTIVTNNKAHILIRSLSQICRDLGITMIAEGVETQEQLQLLRELNCNEAQGYLFSKPLPLSEFEEKYLR